MIFIFDQIDGNKGKSLSVSLFDRVLDYLDGYIIMENFLELCTNRKGMDHLNLFTPSEELERSHFRLMDLKEKGTVSWSDFALFYSCKLIAAKNRVNIHSMTMIEGLVVRLLLDFLNDKINNERISLCKEFISQRSTYTSRSGK